MMMPGEAWKSLKWQQQLVANASPPSPSSTRTANDYKWYTSKEWLLRFKVIKFRLIIKINAHALAMKHASMQAREDDENKSELK